jgi:hypothetical protein
LLLAGYSPASADPTTYGFSTDSAPFGSASLVPFFFGLSVTGKFDYDPDAAAVGFVPPGFPTSGSTIYLDATSDLSGSVGPWLFSDPTGRAIVGNDKFVSGGPMPAPPADFFQLRADPFLGAPVPPAAFGLNGFDIDGFTLVNVRMVWIEGELGITDFLSDQNLPAVLPSFQGRLALDFTPTNDPGVISSVFFNGLTVAQVSMNLVSEINKAPITPDGNVAGAVTDFVIDLDRSLDPAVEGRSLLAGCVIKVTLPDTFVDTEFLVEDVFSSPTCVPGNLQCSTAVLLQGWPQHPLLPHFPIPPLGPATQYAVTLQGTHTLVFTALADVLPGNAAPGPGIKQIHLILRGFRNPEKPGFYPVEVDAQTGPGCVSETGVGTIQILPKTRPSVHVTSVINPGAPNTIYQQATPGGDAPLVWDLLLWARDGDPLKGVTINMVNDDHALLKQGKRTVGHIAIDAPAGASGHGVMDLGPSSAFLAPISGAPAALLKAQFTAGSVVGRYTITISLNGGNSINMFVDVE